MRKLTKVIAAASMLLLLSASLFADPPKRPGEPSSSYSSSSSSSSAYSSLSVVEALQNTFRSISNTMLPAVVEVDVTETKTYTDPFGGMSNPFEFFFGSPRGKNGDDSDKKNQREYESKGLGSGVIVRKTGTTFYVLTNNHVAGSATKISIKLNDGREFEGKLVGADSRIDVALVSFESKDSSIPVAKLGDSDKVQPGDICMAFGAPLGYSQSVTQGIVSAVGRSESHMSAISDYIQTDAAINQGNSGGPLVNIYGEVIGINTWIASSSGGSVGLGFAIPINNLKSAIDSFIKKGKVVYGWVGVSLVDVTKEYKDELGVGDIVGAFAADHADLGGGGLEVEQFYFVDDEFLGLQVHLLAFAGQFVGHMAVHLAGGKLGRHLFYFANEPTQGFLHQLTGDVFRRKRGVFGVLFVVAGRGGAQFEVGDVFLGVQLQFFNAFGGVSGA